MGSPDLILSMVVYPAAVDVLSRTAPPKVEVKEEPLSVKMEGTAEHEPKTASQTQLESKPSNHSNKENVAPYKTPAAKKMAQYANTPGFTPPSTGYGFCAQAWKIGWSKRTTSISLFNRPSSSFSCSRAV